MMSAYLMISIVIFLFVFQTTLSDNNGNSQAGVAADVHVGNENIHRNTDLVKQVEKPGTEQLERSESEADEETQLTFEKLFVQGIRAYDQQQWYSCADNFEKAVTDYKLYKQVLSDCRIDCSKGIRTSKLSNVSSSIHDFSHFLKLLNDADCFRRCKDESLNTLPRLTENLENAFEKRVPYQYLQFCYFKLDRLKQAASAAYTYLLANPDDLDTKQNIAFYRDKAMVPNTDFVDLELVPYKEHYIRAMAAYTEQDWGSVITEVEKSLKDYYDKHERCLVDCGARVKMRGSEFNIEVADMFINILFCKLNCEEKLSIVYTEPINYFLQDMYHYLQFAYYQERNLEKSAEAIASFLVLNSSHAVMRDNKNILKAELQYTDDDFKPQKDVLEYAAIRKEMLDLMDFITKNYRWADEFKYVADDEVPERTEPVKEDWMIRYEKMGIHIIAKSSDLHREGRFVTDGLLKEEQCEELLTLTKDLRVERVGSQKFDLKTAQQWLKDSLDEEYEASLRQLIQATDIVSQYTQRYLGSDVPLYLKEAFIVCWSLVDDPEEIRGCYTQEDGTCVRFNDMCDELSSDTYTTVTYLNTADGTFQFLNEKEQVDSSFGVKCGRTVGFSTSDRHAMKVPSKQGDKRCAMVIRFTSDQGDTKNDYRDTIALLHGMNELRLASAIKSGHDMMKKFEEEGVKIVKNGEELMGKERFVADGLASEAQCSTLRNLVQEFGKAGDGYSGKTSPHTVNEIFAGLHLDQINQIIAVFAEEYTHQSSKTTSISPHTEHELYQWISIFKASKLTHQGIISTFGLRTFLELSEKSRLLVERYFNLTKPLYFDYTQVVCRTALDDSRINRQDLSHPVHSDNCNLQPDGSCTRDFPAFIHRDYSAILYLNSDFEGGEFFFAHSNKTEQVSLRPKCGRLVGFNAGDFHGVKAVKSGQRCALALWFTLDSGYKELAHIQAYKALKRLEEEQKAEDKTVHEEL